MTFTTLTRMADNLLLYKYIIKNVARQNGKTVTFMPKPLFGDNGSGMHVHSSLWKGDTNVFLTKAVMPAFHRLPNIISAASSSTPRRCWR